MSDLTCFRDAAAEFTVAVTQADGNPYDLTGATLEFTAATQENSEEPVVQVDATIQDADAGLALVHLTPEDLATDERVLLWDLVRTDDERLVLQRGILFVRQGVAAA